MSFPLLSLPSLLRPTLRPADRPVLAHVARAAILFLAIGLAIGLALAAGSASAQRKLGVDGEERIEALAAQVGSEIILASEVLEMTAPLESRMREAGAPASEILGIRRDALERLIEAKLIGSVVDRLELGADREEVDLAIGAIAQDNGLTIDQLLASVATHGLTIDEYRAKIQGEIERSKVVNAMVRSRVSITEEEVEALYAEKFGSQREGGEEVHVRHILVLTEGGTVPRSMSEACDITEAARREIADGQAEFPQVAQRVSDMNPERGGDLGWMHREDLAGWMAEAIQGLEPGQVSGVIEMPFGCNLLELVDRRPFQPIDFETAQNQLRNMVFQEKLEVEYTKWLDVLREQTYIERKGSFASGALGS